jgi:hypothetical protein
MHAEPLHDPVLRQLRSGAPACPPVMIRVAAAPHLHRQLHLGRSHPGNVACAAVGTQPGGRVVSFICIPTVLRKPCLPLAGVFHTLVCAAHFTSPFGPPASVMAVRSLVRAVMIPRPAFAAGPHPVHRSHRRPRRLPLLKIHSGCLAPHQVSHAATCWDLV